MKKVMRLVGIQLWAVIMDMLSIGNIRGKKQKALYAGVLLFTIGLGALAFVYCFAIGQGLMMYHSIDILPALMMAVTSMIVLLTTIFKVKGTIFGFKDYDMVMSLPVSTGQIAASRLILLYSVNLIFVLIVMVPMMITYGILAAPGVLFYIYSLLTMLFIPLIPIILASFLGTLIAFIASKFRHSNFVNIIVTMALLTAFIGLSFTVRSTGKELVNFSKELTNQVNTIYPLAGMYTKAVVEYDASSLIIFLVISIAAFLLYSFLIGSVFKKINTIIMTGKYRTNFKMGELKEATPFQALYRKELKRYFSSTIYVLNTGFGIVLLTVGAIALIFVNLDKILGDPQIGTYLLKSAPIFAAFCIVMSCTTMASISLEGRNLWIIKSLPVSPRTIYLAKLSVNFTILAPALFDVILISFILRLGWTIGIITLLVSIVCGLFTSLLGLLVNLKLPSFNWSSETMVVKQSASAMIAIFSGMGIVGIQIIFLVLIPNYIAAYLIYIGIIAAVDFLFYRMLSTWGNRRLMEL